MSLISSVSSCCRNYSKPTEASSKNTQNASCLKKVFWGTTVLSLIGLLGLGLRSFQECADETSSLVFSLKEREKEPSINPQAPSRAAVCRPLFGRTHLPSGKEIGLKSFYEKNSENCAHSRIFWIDKAVFFQRRIEVLENRILEIQEFLKDPENTTAHAPQKKEDTFFSYLEFLENGVVHTSLDSVRESAESFERLSKLREQQYQALQNEYMERL